MNHNVVYYIISLLFFFIPAFVIYFLSFYLFPPGEFSYRIKNVFQSIKLTSTLSFVRHLDMCLTYCIDDRLYIENQWMILRHSPRLDNGCPSMSILFCLSLPQDQEMTLIKHNV